MKLSEIKGEQALDVLADIIEPVTAICIDEEIQSMVKSGVPTLKMVKPIIKNHKKEIVEILAILDGENPAEYEVNVLTLPLKLLELLNDPTIKQLFQSAAIWTKSHFGLNVRWIIWGSCMGPWKRTVVQIQRSFATQYFLYICS